MPRRFLTPGWIFGHILVTASVLLCLRLAWWQLARSHESDGGAQNFGYALLWPLFGAAFVYMWTRFISLEQIRAAEIESEHAENASLIVAHAEELTAHAARSLEQTGTGEALEEHDSNLTHQGEPSAPAVTDIYEQNHLDENEDAGLIAYNRALAALAEQDHRRAL